MLVAIGGALGRQRTAVAFEGPNACPGPPLGRRGLRRRSLDSPEIVDQVKASVERRNFFDKTLALKDNE